MSVRTHIPISSTYSHLLNQLQSYLKQYFRGHGLISCLETLVKPGSVPDEHLVSLVVRPPSIFDNFETLHLDSQTSDLREREVGVGGGWVRACVQDRACVRVRACVCVSPTTRINVHVLYINGLSLAAFD